MKDININKRTKYGYEIFDLAGEITYEETRSIENFIKENISEEYDNIILNMERVPFINSSAISLLVKLFNELKARKIKMHLMNLNETVVGLLKMTGSAKHFHIIKNEDILINAMKNKELDKVLSEIDEV